MDIRSLIRKIPDYPGPGTNSCDFATLHKRARANHVVRKYR